MFRDELVQGCLVVAVCILLHKGSCKKSSFLVVRILKPFLVLAENGFWQKPNLTQVVGPLKKVLKKNQRYNVYV